MAERCSQVPNFKKELNNGQDMLTETTFGQRWGLIERGEASEVLAYVNHNWQSYFVVGLFPRLAKTLKKTSNFRVGFLGTSASKWARPAKLGSLPSVIPVKHLLYPWHMTSAEA